MGEQYLNSPKILTESKKYVFSLYALQTSIVICCPGAPRGPPAGWLIV